MSRKYDISKFGPVLLAVITTTYHLNSTCGADWGVRESACTKQTLGSEKSCYLHLPSVPGQYFDDFLIYSAWITFNEVQYTSFFFKLQLSILEYINSILINYSINNDAFQYFRRLCECIHCWSIKPVIEHLFKILVFPFTWSITFIIIIIKSIINIINA